MKANKQTRLEDRVYDFILGHNLVTPGDRILVAVSGGPDSIALLRLLHNLRNALKVTIVVAHLNHNLRGGESDGDALYVAELAQSMGLPFSIGGRDVNEYRDRHKLTLEEAAREVRYKYLAEVAADSASNLIAIGHTRNDNVETILMHMIRGAGMMGLKGLAPRTRRNVDGQNVTIIRPLLKIARNDIESYCSSLGLVTRTDSTNISMSALRNRIRLELLPLLREYNPAVDEAFLRLSHIAGDELDYIDQKSEEAWEKIALRHGDVIVLERDGFDFLHPALQRSLLRRAAREIYGSLKDIEASHIEDILDHTDRGAGKQVELKGGVVFTIEHSRYLLGKKEETLCPYSPMSGEYDLVVPGETVCGDWKVITEIIVGNQIGDDVKSFTNYFDYDKTGFGLSMRSRKPGDRFIPLGMTHEKKLKDYLIDARVPCSWRDHIPVIVSEGKIVWLAGYRMDEGFKVTEDTQKMLRIEIIHNGDR